MSSTTFTPIAAGKGPMWQLLVRRTRDLLAAETMQCVGKSATLAGPGTYVQQQADVADVASALFGAEVKPEHVSR